MKTGPKTNHNASKGFKSKRQSNPLHNSNPTEQNTKNNVFTVTQVKSLHHSCSSCKRLMIWQEARKRLSTASNAVAPRMEPLNTNCAFVVSIAAAKPLIPIHLGRERKCSSPRPLSSGLLLSGSASEAPCCDRNGLLKEATALSPKVVRSYRVVLLGSADERGRS